MSYVSEILVVTNGSNIGSPKRVEWKRGRSKDPLHLMQQHCMLWLGLTWGWPENWWCCGSLFYRRDSPFTSVFPIINPSSVKSFLVFTKAVLPYLTRHSPTFIRSHYVCMPSSKTGGKSERNIEVAPPYSLVLYYIGLNRPWALINLGDLIGTWKKEESGESNITLFCVFGRNQTCWWTRIQKKKGKI